MTTLSRASLASLVSSLALLISGPALAAEETDPLRLSDVPVPMITEEVMGPRTAPIIELGDPFLSTGRLSEPLVLPTGAVWNPSLWVHGGLRTALSARDDAASQTNIEAAARLDLIANLQLSGTERVVLGVTPLHDGPNYTTYTFSPDARKGWDRHGVAISTLFLEAELAELFPNLDPGDQLPLDIGIAVGRQFIDLQDGMLVNDTLDSVGLVKNNLTLPGVTNLRVTGLFGWGEVNRDDNRRDKDARLWAVSTAWDTFTSTFEADAAYVTAPQDRDSYGDSLHLGFGATQRIKAWNTTARVLYSNSLDANTPAANDGVLMFVETSMTPTGRSGILYINGFSAFGDYTAAARQPGTGGSLGRVGLNFASPQLGTFGPALNNRTSDVAGGAIGYQMFLAGLSTQLTLELAGRADMADNDTSGVSFGAHLQHKLTPRVMWKLDGYVADHENRRDVAVGGRSEIQVLF